MTTDEKILIIGYGNPGRQDDGIAILAADSLKDALAEAGYLNCISDSNFQLNIEDASTIKQYDKVIFVDATCEINVTEFEYTPLIPDPAVAFTMHSVSPQFIMDLSLKLFGYCPDCYLLKIRGYCWEFGLPVSTKAKKNMEKSIRFIKKHFQEQKKLANFQKSN